MTHRQARSISRDFEPGKQPLVLPKASEPRPDQPLKHSGPSRTQEVLPPPSMVVRTTYYDVASHPFRAERLDSHPSPVKQSGPNGGQRPTVLGQCTKELNGYPKPVVSRAYTGVGIYQPSQPLQRTSGDGRTLHEHSFVDKSHCESYYRTNDTSYQRTADDRGSFADNTYRGSRIGSFESSDARTEPIRIHSRDKTYENFAPEDRLRTYRIIGTNCGQEGSKGEGGHKLRLKPGFADCAQACRVDSKEIVQRVLRDC